MKTNNRWYEIEGEEIFASSPKEAKRILDEQKDFSRIHPYRCLICGQRFGNREDCDSHIEGHEEKPQYIEEPNGSFTKIW